MRFKSQTMSTDQQTNRPRLPLSHVASLARRIFLIWIISSQLHAASFFKCFAETIWCHYSCRTFLGNCVIISRWILELWPEVKCEFQSVRPSAQAEVCAKFKENPTRRFWDMSFIRVGQTNVQTTPKHKAMTASAWRQKISLKRFEVHNDDKA